MNRVTITILVCLAYAVGLVVLTALVPRSFYALLLVVGIPFLSIAFLRERYRLLLILCLLCLAGLPWVTGMDVRVFFGHSRKGVFVMPVRYSIDAKMENGVCPGGDIVDRFAPTRAIVISL
jgi:hypothetical protein